MTIDLRSVLAKLGRAQEHADAVKSEIAAWQDSNPYMVTRERNAEFTRYSLVVHIATQPPLMRWTLAIADVVHNLRTALDHLIYAIAVYETKGESSPPNKLAYPICRTSEQFDDWGIGRIKTLTAEVQAIVKVCQPYNRRHKELPPLLLLLNEFDNRDKHKLLQVAFASIATGQVGLVGPTPEGVTMTTHLNRGEICDGTELVVFTVNVPCPNMKFDNFSFAIEIALWHEPGPNGDNRTNATSLLTLLHQEVRSVINDVSAFSLFK
jgi:hypothetical protein